ncbi:hypothetical protein FHS76_003767 [Ochrobactrum daejeonense]|uniref:Uncharacterized protein n=1 Tax=Brucella daejeonensis TaxID=659015 RepID=A0A7W9B0A5_9HYPH|nr:hypothetical protein [Brucella daejeonensis]MBB5703854.1 hypothetical protein [Brucella daejeonensis]
MTSSSKKTETAVLTAVKTEAYDIKNEIREMRQDFKYWLIGAIFVILVINAATVGLIASHVLH